MRFSRSVINLWFCLAIILPACQGLPTPTPNPEGSQPTQTAASTPRETPPPTPGETDGGQLPQAPIKVVFFSADGTELQGTFYPAEATNRPVLVLMHWYQGDQDEWVEIAYWLQNRGGSGTARGVPWLDPSWFPPLPEDASYNVLTFTFRGCEGGCNQLLAEEWLEDALASLAAARSLEGVNPNKVIAVGASIGGDAAVSSCAAALEADPDACLGALSLSPGSYLGTSYPEMAALLSDASRPAWCFYDKADPDAVVCEEASSSHYHKESWEGGNLHGMHLLTSTLDPLPLERMIAFLELAAEE